MNYSYFINIYNSKIIVIILTLIFHILTKTEIFDSSWDTLFLIV